MAEVFEMLEATYAYTPARLAATTTTPSAPYGPPLEPTLDRLPAFIVHAPTMKSQLLAKLVTALSADIQNGVLDAPRVIAYCERQQILDEARRYPFFHQRTIYSEGDATRMASSILDQVDGILAVGYNTAGTVEVKEQRSIPNQRPDRFLAKDGSDVVVWEDKAWNVYEVAAPKILTLATSDQGRSLAFGGMEEHERAMVYQIAVAAYDANVFWSLLFGGNHALLFQRVASAEPTRYGLLCSDKIPVQDLFSVVLALLLVPGSAPLVDIASFMIPAPAPCPPGDSQILTRMEDEREDEYENKDSLNILKSSKNVKVIFRVPGYQPTIVSMSRLPASPDTTPASPPLQSPPDPPPVLTPPQETAVPTLHICELLSIGATGIVFKATGGSMALVVKAIPPGWTGDGDLRNEALMYDALASLQGSALPRMAGCFQGKGWTILVIEDCGRSVTAEDLPFLSLEQRRMLWRHACSIHGSGIVHHDLEPRNLVVSSSGEVRVIDFAFARAGHVCQQISCTELESFQKLLGLDYLPETINLLVD